MRPPTDSPNPNPTTHAHTPLSAREQQLSFWALEVWGGVVSVLLPNAPPAVRDAACAVLDSRDVYSHWENELGDSASPILDSVSPSPGYINMNGTLNGATNGQRSGHGHANDFVNGNGNVHVNGHGNGNANGHANGHTNSHRNSMNGTGHSSNTSATLTTTPDPPLLAGGARDALAALHDLDCRRAQADAYARVLVLVGNLAGSAYSVCELGAQPSANATLPPFPLMRPDAVLGLDPLNVPISVGVDATPLVPPGIKAGLYAASIPRLQTSLCDSPSAPWFPWLFASIVSLDAGVGAAHVNVLTAMRTGLALALKLNTAALERDPANSLPLPPLWRRVYGVYGSGSMWRLLLMVADEKGDFTTTEIWCGSGTLPAHMLQFIGLLSHIAAEAETRRTYVANWLYSLRTSSSHRDLFALQSINTTPRTVPATALQTPAMGVRDLGLNDTQTTRVFRPLPIPIPNAIPEVRRRTRSRRSISDLSHVSHSIPFSSSPLSPLYDHSHNHFPIMPAPSPHTWMSPTRHGRSASTSVLGHGPVASTSAYSTALLSPFPNRNSTTSISVASQLAAAAERSWSTTHGASAGHSYSRSTTNSASPTLSDPHFGDENNGLGLRRF